MASDDPQFEKKATEIIDLYLKPPAMRLFSVSMKRAPFKPLTVLTPCRSLRGGQNVVDSNTFATALSLAFNTATGEVLGDC